MTIDLNKMKARLEAKRAELENSIADLTQAHPEPVGPLEVNEPAQDTEDIATDFDETQKEQSLLVNQQALLTEVERALERIERGTYGICVNCGRPIPEKRLEDIPWAARDVQCEEVLEQRNLSGENA
jgi:DnaK suppressor protein